MKVVSLFVLVVFHFAFGGDVRRPNENWAQFIKSKPKILSVDIGDVDSIDGRERMGQVLSATFDHKDGPVRASIDRYGADHEIDFYTLNSKGAWENVNARHSSQQHSEISKEISRQVDSIIPQFLSRKEYSTRTFEISHGYFEIGGNPQFPLYLKVEVGLKDGNLSLNDLDLKIAQKNGSDLKITQAGMDQVQKVAQDEGDLVVKLFDGTEIDLSYNKGRTRFKLPEGVKIEGTAPPHSSPVIRRFTFSDPDYIDQHFGRPNKRMAKVSVISANLKVRDCANILRYVSF